MPRDLYIPTLIAFCSGALVAGIAAYVGHLFASSREAKSRRHAEWKAARDRRRDFLSFMDVWRSRIERTDLGELGKNLTERIAEFRGEQARIRDDLPSRDLPEFDELVRRLASLGKTEVQAYDRDNQRELGKDTFIARLDDIVSFVRKANFGGV